MSDAIQPKIELFVKVRNLTRTFRKNAGQDATFCGTFACVCARELYFFRFYDSDMNKNLEQTPNVPVLMVGD